MFTILITHSCNTIHSVMSNFYANLLSVIPLFYFDFTRNACTLYLTFMLLPSDMCRKNLSDLVIRPRFAHNPGDDLCGSSGDVVAVKSRTKGRSLLILFGRHFAGH